MTICTRCGKREAREGFTRCQVCADYDARRNPESNPKHNPRRLKPALLKESGFEPLDGAKDLRAWTSWSAAAKQWYEAQSVNAGGTIAKPLVFGFATTNPTKFGSRPGPRGPRQSGLNPSEKGRQNELTAIELIRLKNPDLDVRDKAEARAQLGYDIELWRADKFLAAIDSSTDRVLQEHEYQAMLRLAQQGTLYYIFLADSQKMHPVTPETTWQIAARKV